MLIRAFRGQAAPPTRGWTPCPLLRGQAGHGCPAYAGMDPRTLFLSSALARLPRLRGDGPREVASAAVAALAAPPTRGWTRPLWICSVPVQGCPAYAGMDPGQHSRERGTPGLPRLRGDGPDLMARQERGVLAAPPTRGWTRRAPICPDQATGCPAYAGMDPWYESESDRRQRLPRLRGDGPC